VQLHDSHLSIKATLQEMRESLTDSTENICKVFPQHLHHLKEEFERNKEKTEEEESDAEILKDASTIEGGKIDVVAGVNLQARRNIIKIMVKERKLANPTYYLPALEVNITPAPQLPRKTPDKVLPLISTPQPRSPLQEMLHFARGRSPGKMPKSLGNWTFARSFARSRITSKSAHRK